MSERKIHILFRGKTKQSGEKLRRELFWLLHNIKENEGEKREKYEKKLENWLEAYPFIKKQIVNQVDLWDGIADKLINFMGRTDVFNPDEQVVKRLRKHLGEIK